jgi:hypothetical protein
MPSFLMGDDAVKAVANSNLKLTVIFDEKF